MLINIALYILSLPLYILSLFSGVINTVIPSWLTTGIDNIMGGTGVLNTFLPMYPHAGMSGLAGQIGIMTIFGWAVTLMGYLITLSLAYKLIRLLVALLPWNTHGANIKTGGH